MRPFAIEISRSRMPGGELSEAQRIYVLAQAQGGCSTREIANRLGCTGRAVQKILHRWETDSTYTTHTRMGRPPILTSRDHRLLLWVIKRYPKIEYNALFREAGLWNSHTDLPTVSRSTIQRSLA
jgi:transposase